MITLNHVSKRYGNDSSAVDALKEVSLDIPEHAFASITGPSGCGKSTLLNLLGSLDAPTSGEIFVGDIALHNADETAKTTYRRHHVGIVFQFFNLMPTMTVEENVSLPLILQGKSHAEARNKAHPLLELVGLKERLRHSLHQLSGGEMQRTAIARALVHEPQLVIADEPTGNLDSDNELKILELLERIYNQKLTTLVMVTHSKRIAKRAGMQIEMKDGLVSSVHHT